jgi:hypothetical protein
VEREDPGQHEQQGSDDADNRREGNDPVIVDQFGMSDTQSVKLGRVPFGLFSGDGQLFVTVGGTLTLRSPHRRPRRDEPSDACQ